MSLSRRSVASMASGATHTPSPRSSIRPIYVLVTYAVADEAKGDAGKKTGSFAWAKASTPFATVSSFCDDNPKRWLSSRATSPNRRRRPRSRRGSPARARNDAMACRIFVRSPASSACSARAALRALWPTASSGLPSSKKASARCRCSKYVPTSSPARTLRETDRVDGVERRGL